MKTKLSIWLSLTALSLSLYGQQAPETTITVTPKDVKPQSVLFLGERSDKFQNVVFEFVGRTSDEVRDLRLSRRRIQIVKDGIVVVPDVGCGALKSGKSGTNYIGLCLIFTNYDQAKLTERILRGEK